MWFGDKDGDKIVRKVYPEIKKRVISTKTAAEMTRILTSVVEGGTGERAAIEGHRVSWKDRDCPEDRPRNRSLFQINTL